MRWPLRNQIMLPMAAVMLLTVFVVAGLGAWLAVRGTKARIEAQIREVAQLVKVTDFPLTVPVLKQMKSLSGAELVVLDGDGRLVASSGSVDDGEHTLRDWRAPGNSSALWTDQVSVHGGRYFHAAVSLPPQRNDQSARLHILYPEMEYRRAWQRAVYPSIVFAALALPVVMVLAYATAARIAGRVGRLHEQMDRIAGGDFQQFALPAGDDEIRALAVAVNRMASMLANYEQEIRRTERMRTLAHLGGGIAHQLRNSATGCAMAVDLHADECPLGAESESLSVAKRQLRLMEEYVQRFLQLGKSDGPDANQPIDLAKLVTDLLPLVQPAARHAGVQLQWNGGDGIGAMTGNAERLSQLVINVLLNAVEAAAQGRARNDSPGLVRIELSRPSDDRLVLRVSDSGPGPAEHVQTCLFEPFVTEKPDGVGLGLSVAREIVAQHGGHIDWHRAEDMTCFTIELPTNLPNSKSMEIHRVAIVGG